jgi:hypothetical protein
MKHKRKEILERDNKNWKSQIEMSLSPTSPAHLSNPISNASLSCRYLEKKT